MPEQLSQSEFGNNWIIIGQNPGQKTQALMDFDATNPAGITVRRGISLGVSFYNEYVNLHHGQPTFRYDSVVPTELRQTNQRIVDLFSLGIPVAVRSSAIDEKGGPGIYASFFLNPVKDRTGVLYDLEALEQNVYASYSTKDALMYQKQRELMGMGILIQPIVGSWYGDYFMPALSGVCTYLDGRPLIRTVIGLGTKAVRVDEALIFEDPIINPQQLDKGLQTLHSADTLSKYFRIASADRVSGNVAISDELRNTAIAEAPKLLQLAKVWKHYAVTGQYYYWEFAIDPSSPLPCIVQCALEDPYISVPVEPGEPEGRVILKGRDMVNKGTRTGRGIFFLTDSNDLDKLAAWNILHDNYLFLTEDVMLSKDQRSGIAFRHFSNASVFGELQTTGTHGTALGGTHFSEVCKRKDILFLGARLPTKRFDYLQLLGEPTEKIGTSFYWDLRFKATNAATSGRIEVLDPSLQTRLNTDIKVEESPEEPENWLEERGDMLYNLGYKLYSQGRLSKAVLSAFIKIGLLLNLASQHCAEPKDLPAYITSLPKKQVRKLMLNVRLALNLPGSKDTLLNRKFSFILDSTNEDRSLENLENLLENLLGICKEKLSNGHPGQPLYYGQSN